LLRANVPPQDFLARLTDAARERSIDLDASGGCDPGVNHYKYDEPEAAKLKYLLNFVLAPTDRDVLIDTLFEQCFEGDEASISRQLYMSPEQIAELGRERWIGTHAHEHLPLGLMTDDAAELQIEQSAALLARWTGERPFALSYPYGSREASSPAVAAAAVGRGIEYAFTMERAGNANLTSPLHLARFDNNDMPGGKAARWQIDELFSAVTPRTWFTEAQMAGETN
jgi:hypothetical protein